jgi:hypothetical protein
MAPSVWRQLTSPPTETGGRSMRSIIGEAVVDGLLFRPSASRPMAQTVQLSQGEREAYARKRKGGKAGFEVRLLLELAGTDPDAAKAELWRLIEFTEPLSSGVQRIHWEPRLGAVTKPPTAKLATARSSEHQEWPQRPDR